MSIWLGPYDGGRYPIERLAKLCLGRLRMTPDHFWSMTPRELVATFEGIAEDIDPPFPFSDEEIEDAMRRFPDG